MNITSTPSSSLDGVITIQLQEEDYLPHVTQRLLEKRATARMKGFRPGQVPISLLRKKYGNKLLFEVSMRLALQPLYNHLENQNLIAMPIMVDSTFEHADFIDIEHPGVLEFKFMYGLRPTIDFAPLAQINVNHYKITAASKDHIADYIHHLRVSYGKLEEVSVAEKEDMLYVSFCDAEAPSKSVYLPVTGMQLGDEDFNFVGYKPGDTFTLDFGADKQIKLPNNNEHYDAVKPYFNGCKGQYELEVKKVVHITPADIDDVLQNKQDANSNENLATLQDLEACIGEVFIEQAQSIADRMLVDDLHRQAVHHVTFELPADFMKAKLEQDAEIHNEEVCDYESAKDYLSWKLLREEICNFHNCLPTTTQIAQCILDKCPEFAQGKNLEAFVDALEHSIQAGNPHYIYTSFYNTICATAAIEIIKQQATIHNTSVTTSEFEAHLKKKSKNQ